MRNQRFPKKRPSAGRPAGRTTGRTRPKPRAGYAVVYEDKDILVVNKRAGVLSVPVPGSRGGRTRGGSNDVLTQLQQQYNHNESRGVFVVHRIDRYTSGLLVFARTPAVRRALIAQFKDRLPIREYHAVVRGVVEQDRGGLVHHLHPVSKSFMQRAGKKDAPGAARAELKFEVIERAAEATLVRVFLVSGLKGQIRAQFAEIGHPLIGDRQYAEQEREQGDIDRQALHSARLTITHPRTKEQIAFEAFYPADFSGLLEKCGFSDSTVYGKEPKRN